MTAHSLPITKSHFLRKLHERQIQQRFEGLERQVEERRRVEPKRSQRSQASWKWLAVPLLTLALSSSIITYYAGSQDEQPTIQDELVELSGLLSKLDRLSTTSKALSSSYLSQAFSSPMEPEDRRAFLQVESKVNQLFQADIKPGPSDLSRLNSNPIAQDRLPLGNGNSLLPDGLWLKQKAAVHQQVPDTPKAPEAPVKESTPEPVVQNRYVSPTTGSFRWPTTGPISQGAHRYHMALDIAVPFGTPILAADGGLVVEAGWNNTGYGNLVVIDHQNGYHTYYAHLSSFAIQVGATVNQGSLIGQVGSTGNSTGPHLHFEIRLQNILQNPFNFLY